MHKLKNITCHFLEPQDIGNLNMCMITAHLDNGNPTAMIYYEGGY